MAGHTAPLENLAIYSDRARTAVPWDTAQRALDIVLVAITLPLWVPVVFLMAALKVLSDGRPVWFRHVRLGRDGNRFVLYKIRTTPDGFQPGPHDWSDEEFPPRTPFGRWLRRFDLDELPQLWNVLKGDMSLVGPRPAIPQEVEQYQAWQRRRLRMRPGLTCLWALAGRDAVDFEAWMKMDMQYIDNWSLGLDWKILLLTIPKVLSGKGAH